MSLQRYGRAAALAIALSLLPLAAVAEGGAAGDSAAIAEPMVLSEQQLTRFFDAADALRALGEEAEGPRYDRTNPQAFAKSMQLSEQAQAILKKNGFADPAAFQRVGFNAAMAYSVLQRGGQAKVDADVANARAAQAKAMAEISKHLSPEQVRAMGAQAEQGMAMVGRMQDVPPQNVELMKQFAPRMQALERQAE